MRRLLALPLLIAVCMGMELPPDGPVPLQNPRSPAKLEPATLQANEPARNPAETEKSSPLPSISRPRPDEAALAHCEAELRKLGAVFSRQHPVNGENGCGIEAPYRIAQIVRGVSLSPASQLRCETALALARWMDAVVVPAAAAFPEMGKLIGITHGSTYVCRRRNNLPTGKMSEHSIGNAIDIAGFEFGGRRSIGISPRQGDGGIEEAFQRAVRGGACLHFTTVLGPGSDASHAGHLHLDIAKRRGGYRLCQ